MTYIYFLLFLVSAVSVALATITQIEAQLGFVSSNSTNWDSLINAFSTSEPTLLGALDIHEAALTFNQSLATIAKMTAANGPLNLANGTAILDVVLKCGKDLEDALSVIISEKISFEDLPVSGFVELILNDLIALNASGVAFADSFIEDAPVSLLPNATALKDIIFDAFATAIAAFN